MQKLRVLMLLVISMASNASIFIPYEGKQMVLTGTVTKPITEEEPVFTAHYLELDKPLTFNDDGGCSEIKQRMIALNEFGMSRYQGKKVSIKGTVRCQLEYTGSYHLSNFTITIIEK